MESATETGDAAKVTRASSALTPSASSRDTYIATMSRGASVGAPFTVAERRARRACASTEAPSSSVSASARASTPKSSSKASTASGSPASRFVSLSSPSTRSWSRTARSE